MAVQALIDFQLEVPPITQIAQTALAERSSGEAYPNYFRSLQQALEAHPPPFGASEYRNVFREAASDPEWMAKSLIVNSQREGDGATRLWSMAAHAPNEEEKQLLKRHAIDESGHALGYLRLLDIVFPGAVTAELRTQLQEQLSPHYSPAQEPAPVPGSPYARTPSVDDYIQMNIAEIRTTIHHLFQREALARYCAQNSLRRMRATLDMLMRDELSHVAYTAQLIEQKASDFGGERVAEMFSNRMRDFNEITRQELGENVFD